MDGQQWSNLPTHVLVSIFSYVSQNDRLSLSLVCKDWSDLFHDSQLWRHFIFKFDTNKDQDGKALVCAERYSKELKDVEILVNQSQTVSRDRAVEVLGRLSNVELWKLTRFKFGFTGNNPLCFNGKYMLDKMKDLLRSVKDKDVVFNLQEIDLSNLSIALDDGMLDIFSNYHTYLRVIHIQNECLVDNITHHGVLRLVNSCVFLEELHAFYHCVTDEVISVLAEENRSPLKMLSLMCNRSDKFKSMVSSEEWASLKKASPNIELVMKFHSTMPRHMINPILCPSIPVTEIDLHLYAWVHEEVQHIADICCSTLRYLSFHTSLDPNAKANAELPPALLSLVSNCVELEELHCHCILPEDTIDSIKRKRNLKRSTLYSERIAG